jgi:hypothetical protein
MITYDELIKLLSYDPIEGGLVWIVLPRCRPRTNLAGSILSDGRRRIGINGTYYLAHRLIWLYFHKKWPDGALDHVNGNPADNRIENLREATRSQNQENRKINANNTSGFKWVSWCKQHKKWRSRIRRNGKRIHQNFHDTAEEAYIAACEVAKKHHQEFYNPGR